jgi:hypothetical protein
MADVWRLRSLPALGGVNVQRIGDGLGQVRLFRGNAGAVVAARLVGLRHHNAFLWLDWLSVAAVFSARTKVGRNINGVLSCGVIPIAPIEPK